MEDTAVFKLFGELGLAAAVIAYTLISGDRRETRQNTTMNEVLSKVSDGLEKLLVEQAKGNELLRLLLHNSAETKEPKE